MSTYQTVMATLLGIVTVCVGVTMCATLWAMYQLEPVIRFLGYLGSQ
jgi:hypothetical protein